MTRFLIIDLVKWNVRVQAMTAEKIEKSYHKPMTAIPRDITQVIGEYPDALGVDIETFKTIPRSVILDGITRYAENKRKRDAP